MVQIKWPRKPTKSTSALYAVRSAQPACQQLAAVLILSGTMAVSAPGAEPTRLAQGAGEPQIAVAPAILAEPASQVLLPIRVSPPDALPKRSFISLRGLPASTSLTEGHAIGPGSWAIPLAGLPTLRLNIPAGVSGRTEVVVSLIGTDGRLIAEARTTLVVGPVLGAAIGAESQEGSPPARVAVRPATPPARAAPSAEDTLRAEHLLAEGDKHLAQGKVAGARLFFRQAADLGLAAGAIRLAATYDPTELSRLKVLGLTPDPAEARRWYERARELGAPEAEQRLARLTRN